MNENFKQGFYSRKRERERERENETDELYPRWLIQSIAASNHVDVFIKVKVKASFLRTILGFRF